MFFRNTRLFTYSKPTAEVAMNTVNVKYVLRDELINIYMMTEGISVYPKYAQVFLCKRHALPNTQTDNYYILDSKKSSPIYELSNFGKEVTQQLSVPELKYIAKIDCQLRVNVTKKLFANLNPDYFPVWTPESPYVYFNGQSIGHLAVFRVFEIENPINEQLLEKGRRGRNSVFGLYDSEGKTFELQVNLIRPVLKDDEFLIIKQDIIHRLNNIGDLIAII